MDDVPDADDPADAADAADQRRIAAALFNGVWAILEQQTCSAADDGRMVHMAHASRHHWGAVGGAEHLARVAGDSTAAQAEGDRAFAVEITDDEDRAMFRTDLATIPNIEIKTT